MSEKRKKEKKTEKMSKTRPFREEIMEIKIAPAREPSKKKIEIKIAPAREPSKKKPKKKADEK